MSGSWLWEDCAVYIHCSEPSSELPVQYLSRGFPLLLLLSLFIWTRILVLAEDATSPNMRTEHPFSSTRLLQ